MTQYIFYSNYVTNSKRLHECCRKGASSFINLFMHNLIDKPICLCCSTSFFTIRKFTTYITFVIYPRCDFNQSCESGSEWIWEFSGLVGFGKIMPTPDPI